MKPDIKCQHEFERVETEYALYSMCLFCSMRKEIKPDIKEKLLSFMRAHVSEVKCPECDKGMRVCHFLHDHPKGRCSELECTPDCAEYMSCTNCNSTGKVYALILNPQETQELWDLIEGME